MTGVSLVVILVCVIGGASLIYLLDRWIRGRPEKDESDGSSFDPSGDGSVGD